VRIPDAAADPPSGVADGLFGVSVLKSLLASALAFIADVRLLAPPGRQEVSELHGR